MRRTDRGRNPQAQQEPTQRRGKIAARHASHPTRITIKGELMRTSIGLQKADHRFHLGLFVEIRVFPGQTRRSRCQHPQNCTPRSHAGACRCRAVFSRHTTDIFAIHLNLLQRLPRRSRASASSVAWAEDTRFCAAASRPFGWTGASELLRLAGLDHAVDTRAGLGHLGGVPGAQVERDASPQCGFRRAGRSRK
jgi:hypothetical protein